ncbi:MAG: hypothetical protein EOS18_06310 [Mesorhizobium sp.]|nr:MAG: hypothetical protein EOS18_06310 [Mesorhizobium sp.]
MTVILQIARQALSDYAQVLALSRQDCDPVKIKIDFAPKPHRPTGLPSGYQAVYCFFLADKALKIGMAGPNSDARYRSQHYSPGSALSTLAGSLLSNPGKAGVPAIKSNFVGDWIKANTDRVNFLIPAPYGRAAASQMEAFLHARWSPIYEGRAAP